MKTKQALRDGQCSWCQKEVTVGDALFPVLESICQLSRAAAAADASTPATTSAKVLTYCQPIVQAATSTTTTTTTTTSRNSIWIHATPCAEQVFQKLKQPLEPPPCRHWLRLNRCPFDSDCFFMHPTPQSQQQLLPPLEKRTWGGRRKKLFKPTSSVFRAWLLDTFGHGYFLKRQQKQSITTTTAKIGVLDIAGGKGELAFELENLSGIRTHVVDPRPLTLRNAFLKWTSGHYDKAATSPVFQKYLTHYYVDKNHVKPPSYPGHLRVFFDSKLLHGFLRNDCQQNDSTCTTNQDSNSSSSSLSLEKNLQEAQQEWWKQCRATARQQAWTKKGLRSSSERKDDLLGNKGKENEWSTTSTTNPKATNNSPSPTTLQSWLSAAPEDVSNAEDAIDILSNCSAVIGLHPDQATEACVDFALATNKPFAVVPCCVFSSRFPNRRLQSDGTPVRSTQQLIQYLMEKDERIQVDTLGFEGMNKVVYLSPDHCHKQQQQQQQQQPDASY